MKYLHIDKEKCSGCGLCNTHCGYKIPKVTGKTAAFDRNNPNCIECMHCLGICPNGAIQVKDENASDLVKHPKNETTHPGLSRRSCRHFKADPPSEAVIRPLINDANLAPRFGLDFKARKFTVISDKKRLEAVRQIVLKQLDSWGKMFRTFSKIPFLPQEKRRKFKELGGFFAMVIERNTQKDTMFHGAPVLVIISGPKKDQLSGENCVYALSQLLLLAESRGIASCINGFVPFCHKAVGAYLNVEKSEQIFSAAMLGYGKDPFSSYFTRNDATIEWH